MIERLSAGRVERGRHMADGNAALLVLVDSSGPYQSRSIVDETVLVALEHFGLPYRLLDLAEERPGAALLAGCAGVVLAQDGLGGRVSEAETKLLADAVAGGLGVVNLDWDLRQYGGAWLEVFGFEGIEQLPFASDLIRVATNEHYITWLQEPNAFHKSKRMVTALSVGGWRAGVDVLAEMALGKEQLVYTRHLVPGNAFEPRHYPALFAGTWRDGRAVQYVVNPRVWRSAAVGHLGGLDDIFLRSILWAVRKPFVANIIPPFVTMSFDDCTGRQDFRYLEVCRRHGYVPLVSLLIDTIKEGHLPVLRAKLDAGEILVNTHAMSYYDLQVYNFGVGEHSEEGLAERFARDDAFYAHLGAGCAITYRDHWGEIGVRALPYLKQRGRLFINTPVYVGEHKADQFVPPAARGYWPYDSTLCYYDRLPDDNDFMVLGAFNFRHLVDFLTGTTTLLQESPFNDVQKAGAGAAFQIRHGLSNGFYADVLTHEQKFSVLTLDEYDRILARAGQLTARFDKIQCGYDDISRYVRAKEGTWMGRSERAGGALRFAVGGRAEVPLRVSVYDNVDGGVDRRYIEVPPFAGQFEGVA